MNEKILKTSQLVVGCISAMVGIFFLILSIMTLTNLSGENSALANVYLVLIAILGLAFVALMVFVSLYTIKGFVKNVDERKWVLYAICGFLCYEVLSSVLTLCCINVSSALLWIVTIFSLAGLIVIALSIYGSFDQLVKAVLEFFGCGIAFVIAIIAMANSGGLNISANLFVMFNMMACGVYLAFDLVNKQDKKPVTEE